MFDCCTSGTILGTCVYYVEPYDVLNILTCGLDIDLPHHRCNDHRRFSTGETLIRASLVLMNGCSPSSGGSM